MVDPTANEVPDQSNRANVWSEAEFAAQVKSSFRVLWIIAVGILRDRELAEDAVQEATLIGLQKRGQFEPGTSFSAWMGQMVRNVALNIARKEQRRRTQGESDVADLRQGWEEAPALRITPDGRLPDDQRHFDDRVMRALGSLNETARTCLLLRTIEGLEYSEISRLLSIPEGTAMSHVHRTRRALREQLADLWRNSADGRKRPS